MKSATFVATRIGITFMVALYVLPEDVRAATWIVKDRARTSVETAITDDLFAFSEHVVIQETGSVAEDFIAAGNTIAIKGPVLDDVHVAGVSIHVASTIGGDLFAIGQSIVLSEMSVVKKDLYLAARSIELKGVIGGSVRVISEEAIRIAKNSKIAGDIIVYGNQEPVIEEGAVITGHVVRVNKDEDRDDLSALLSTWVRSVIAVSLVSLFLLYVFSSFTHEVISNLRTKPGTSFITAIVWFVLLIPVSIILMISIVGIPLAISGIMLTPVFWIAASGLSTLFIGLMITEKLASSSSSIKAIDWPHALLGAVVYETVQLLGAPGYLVTSIAVLFVYGALLNIMYKRIKQSFTG